MRIILKYYYQLLKLVYLIMFINERHLTNSAAAGKIIPVLKIFLPVNNLVCKTVSSKK